MRIHLLGGTGAAKRLELCHQAMAADDLLVLFGSKAQALHEQLPTAIRPRVHRVREPDADTKDGAQQLEQAELVELCARANGVICW